MIDLFKALTVLGAVAAGALYLGFKIGRIWERASLSIEPLELLENPHTVARLAELLTFQRVERAAMQLAFEAANHQRKKRPNMAANATARQRPLRKLAEQLRVEADRIERETDERLERWTR